MSVQGEAHGSAILSEEDVRDIRKSYLTGNYSFTDLADGYKVTKSAIQYIICGWNWRAILSDEEAEQLRLVRQARACHKQRRKEGRRW